MVAATTRQEVGELHRLKTQEKEHQAGLGEDCRDTVKRPSWRRRQPGITKNHNGRASSVVGWQDEQCACRSPER